MAFPGRIRVKVCGITRAEDAQFAAACGADALGFIFFPGSPRCLSPPAAAAIIAGLPPLLHRVGVFVDAPLSEVVTTAAVGLTALQLHGQESPDYCRQLRRLLPHCALIKAFRVGPVSRAADFAPYRQLVDTFLLDTYLPGAPGGTGQTFDWSLITALELRRPLILAGGLSPANLAEAVSAVRPYAVDVNSGVERQPGVKDHALLQTFFALLAAKTIPIGQ
jgi:phosphoribosylanthranilate isomerase